MNQEHSCCFKFLLQGHVQRFQPAVCHSETAGKEKRGNDGKKKQKLKYLFFHKLTLELVGVLEALTEHLDGGAVCLSDVTQTLLLQFTDLWDLVFTKSTTKSADEHEVAHLRM